jgi:hypothetical protein
MAKIGYDTNLWSVLAESKDPLTLGQIVEKTGFDPKLLSMSSSRYFLSCWVMTPEV